MTHRIGMGIFGFAVTPHEPADLIARPMPGATLIGGNSMRAMPTWKLLLASALCLAAAAAPAEEVAKTAALEAKHLPAAPSHDDLQACLKETDDYVTRGKTVLYVIGLTNSCDKRLRCEIFANVTGARGSAQGHAVMTLGAAGGPTAKQTYSMHVKAAGGMAQISRECKVL